MRKAEKLREWADKRETKAAATFKANEPHTKDWAFITQPGHIPVRARIIAQEDRAYESLSTAQDFRSRADGIEAAADNAIYNDDPDAIEQLKARIADLEAERELHKKKNAEFRKAHKDELAKMDAYDRHHAIPYPAYSLSNLSGNINRNKKRLAQLMASK